MSSPPKLELYYFAECPFCMMVLNTLKTEKIKVEYKNTLQDPENRDFLIKETGRATVPCLFIDGKPMHESADIINWLKSNSSQLEKES